MIMDLLQTLITVCFGAIRAHSRHLADVLADEAGEVLR